MCRIYILYSAQDEITMTQHENMTQHRYLKNKKERGNKHAK